MSDIKRDKMSREFDSEQMSFTSAYCAMNDVKRDLCGLNKKSSQYVKSLKKKRHYLRKQMNYHYAKIEMLNNSFKKSMMMQYGQKVNGVLTALYWIK